MRRLTSIVKVLISAGLLYVLLRSVAWNDIATSLRRANLFWFGGALVAGFGQWLVSAWRWQMILKGLGDVPPPLKTLVRHYVVSGFFNNFAPANLAGDAVRVGALYRGRSTGLVAASSVVVERVLNLASLGVLCVWAVSAGLLPVTLQIDAGVGPMMIVCAVAGLLAIGLWRWQAGRLRGWLEQVGRLVRTMAGQPRKLGTIVAATFALHIVTMLTTYCTLNAVGASLSLTLNLAVYAVAGALIALPLSVQGIGVREGVYLGLLTPLGVSRESILAALVLNYGVLVIFSAVGGGLFLMDTRRTSSQVK